jgi:multidrug efflux pump subunit AcrB
MRGLPDAKRTILKTSATMNLIQTFVHNPVKVAVGVILIVLFGIISMFAMPMQLTPEVEIPTLTIQTTWPGASPQEVEREIVQEQEEQLKSVEGVRKMSSESMDSMGSVTLEFPVGVDMQEAMLKVNTKLAQVPDYPEDANEPVINTSNASDQLHPKLGADHAAAAAIGCQGRAGSRVDAGGTRHHDAPQVLRRLH